MESILFCPIFNKMLYPRKCNPWLVYMIPDFFHSLPNFWFLCSRTLRYSKYKTHVLALFLLYVAGIVLHYDWASGFSWRLDCVSLGELRVKCLTSTKLRIWTFSSHSIISRYSTYTELCRYYYLIRLSVHCFWPLSIWGVSKLLNELL